MPVVLNLKPAQPKQTTAASLSEMRRYVVRQRKMLRGFIVVCCLAFIAVGFLVNQGYIKSSSTGIHKRDRPPTTLRQGLLQISIPMALLIGLISHLIWTSRKANQWNAEIQLLCESDSPHDVGALLEALCSLQLDASIKDNPDQVSHDGLGISLDTSPETTSAIWETLVRLLPLIKAQETYRLNEEQREILRAILRRDKIYRSLIDRNDREYSRMHLAIVAALKVMGDSRDLPTLCEVASGKILEIASSVRQEAEGAIITIQSRMGGEKAREELLRASGANVGMDQLLRAASYGEVLPKNEMLRASSKE